MTMDPKLIITNVGFVLAFILTMGLGFFVLLRGPKKTPNRIFFFLSVAHGIWEISYVIGINLHDSALSHLAFMGNLATLFIPVAMSHLVLNITDKLQKQKKVLLAFYAVASALTLFFSFFPYLFLGLSEPKLYLPNFFVPGKYYFVGDIFFFTALAYGMYQLFSSYRHADYALKNRLRYFLIAVVYSYTIGLVPEFLLYNIPIDPFASSFMALYMIPLAYSIIENNLIDINVIAKRALWYSLGVTAVALLITLVNALNDLLIERLPLFPHWLVPIFSGAVAVATGVGVWKKIREVDILKYEFINVVTHKFRTPLTQIKWSSEMLNSTTNEKEREEALSIIQNANSRLVELTTALVSLNDNDDNSYQYSFENVELGKLVKETIANLAIKVREKNIQITADIPDGLPYISGEKEHLQFAIRTIIDNALTYSASGEKVTVSLRQDKNALLLSVTDQGIGISKENLDLIFSKFFRSNEAKHTDTEGMGIGLFVTKNIVNRHRGKVFAKSEGVGLGSTFFLRLPIK